MSRSAGFSLLEVVVALGMLAACIAAMTTFQSQETRGLDLSLERHYAQLALADLQAAFSDRAPGFFERFAFPETIAGFTELHRSVIEDAPFVVAPAAAAGTATTNPVLADLQAELARLGIERFVLYQGFEEEGGGRVGVVRFLVRYRDERGMARELATLEVVR